MRQFLRGLRSACPRLGRHVICGRRRARPGAVAHRRDHLSVRPGRGPVRRPAKNASDLLVEALNKGGLAPGLRKERLRRPPDRARLRRRGRRPDQGRHRIPQPGGPPERRHDHRRDLVRRLPGRRAGGRRAEEVHRSCSTAPPTASSRKPATSTCSAPRPWRPRRTSRPRATSRRTIPNLKSFSGINPNYAWGQDAWSDFTEAMKILKPQAQIATNVTPKLGAGQYGAEISALLGSDGRDHRRTRCGAATSKPTSCRRRRAAC